MFIDASAILSILTNEPDAQLFTEIIQSNKHNITSVLVVWEATVGLYRKKSMSMADAASQVKEFLDIAYIEVLPLTNLEMSLSLEAFDQYGRHRYPDKNRNSALNLADCFHYSSAKLNHVPILTKDAGFALTDIKTFGVNS